MRFAGFGNDAIGNRTRVTAVKGRCLNRLTMAPYGRFKNDRPNIVPHARPVVNRFLGVRYNFSGFSVSDLMIGAEHVLDLVHDDGLDVRAAVGQVLSRIEMLRMLHEVLADAGGEA